MRAHEKAYPGSEIDVIFSKENLLAIRDQLVRSVRTGFHTMFRDPPEDAAYRYAIDPPVIKTFNEYEDGELIGQGFDIVVRVRLKSSEVTDVNN